MESCEIQCVSSEQTIAKQNNTVTYNLSHLRQNYDQIAKRIRQIFKDKSFYSRDGMVKEIQIGKPYPLPDIYYTIGEFLKNKNENIIYNGRVGHLSRNDNIYSFKPNEITDPNASLYDRMVPLDYKHRDFNVKLPDKDEVPIFPDNPSVVEIVPKPNYKAVPLKEDRPEREDSYELIKNNIERSIKFITDNTPYVHSTTNKYKEYAKHAYTYLLERHHIEKSIIKYWITQHFIDCLSFSQKQVCFKHFFQSDTDFDKDIVVSYTNIEDVMYSYYRDRIVKNENVIGIYIGNTVDNELFIWKQNKWQNGTENIVDSEKLTLAIESKFGKLDSILKKVGNEIKKETLQECMIGYISHIPKDNKYEFKTKNLFETRNAQGSRCNQEPKGTIVTRINGLLSYLDKPEDEKYDMDLKDGQDKYIYKPSLCIIYETLLRMSTVEKKESWFLSIEESLLYQPKQLSYDRERSDWTKQSKKIITDIKKKKKIEN
jgi:hypothetical protein